MVPSVSTKIITVKKYTTAIEAPMVRNIKYHPNSEYHIVNNNATHNFVLCMSCNFNGCSYSEYMARGV